MQHTMHTDYEKQNINLIIIIIYDRNKSQFGSENESFSTIHIHIIFWQKKIKSAACIFYQFDFGLNELKKLALTNYAMASIHILIVSVCVVQYVSAMIGPVPMLRIDFGRCK